LAKHAFPVVWTVCAAISTSWGVSAAHAWCIDQPDGTGPSHAAWQVQVFFRELSDHAKTWTWRWWKKAKSEKRRCSSERADPSIAPEPEPCCCHNFLASTNLHIGSWGAHACIYQLRMQNGIIASSTR
jgi:hypothetical protein